MPKFNNEMQYELDYLKPYCLHSKIRKYGNGNVFLSLMKTVANLVGKKKLYIFVYWADLEMLSCVSKFLPTE